MVAENGGKGATLYNAVDVDIVRNEASRDVVLPETEKERERWMVGDWLS